MLPSTTFWVIKINLKGPVYIFAIGEYIKPDTSKNLTWRISATTSCMPSCARINK